MLKSLFKLLNCLLLQKEEDSLIETRVRFYKQMNMKTSQSLPPDEKSMLQAIKSINYEVCYSSTVDEAIVSDILLHDNVRIVDNKNEEVRPLWFTGMFLISCFHFHNNQQIYYHLSLEKLEKMLFFWLHSLKNDVIKIRPVLITKT